MTVVMQLPGVVTAADPSAATPSPRRMAIAALALVGVIISLYMSLYTFGAIEAIACGTGACAIVQASPWAVFAGIPVPYWGLGGYGAILALAIAGLQPGGVQDRRIAAALLLLTGFAFGFSMYLSYVEAVLIQAWCRWCIASAVLATLLFAAALPELGRFRVREGDS